MSLRIKEVEEVLGSSAVEPWPSMQYSRVQSSVLKRN